MSYDIHISRRAESDIAEALNYIDHVLKNPDAADALLDKTMDVIFSLAEQPYRIPLIDDKLLSAWGLRFIIINNYLAFFIIDESSKRIIVVRFLYNKRDWITILKQGFPIE